MSEAETASLAGPVEGAPLPPRVDAAARVPIAWALLLAGINVLWAGSAIPAKVALTAGGGIGPCGLAFLRFAPAAVILAVILRARGQSLRVQRGDWPAFISVGVFGLAVTYVVFYTGMVRATATDATLLIATEPILTVLMARALLRERLRRTQWAGLVVGLMGAYVIVSQGLRPTFSGTVAANATVAAALCFEAYASVVGKRLAGRYPGLVVLSIEFLVGASVLLPLAGVEFALRPRAHLPLEAWAGLAYLALVCSLLCYGVWFWLLPRMDVSRMVGFLFIQPMMGPLYGYVLLGERLTTPSAVGAALVVVGVWLVAVAAERAHRRGRPAAVADA